MPTNSQLKQARNVIPDDRRRIQVNYPIGCERHQPLDVVIHFHRKLPGRAIDDNPLTDNEIQGN